MDLEAKKRFAEIIVNLRAGRDLRSFARELGVQHSTIIDWESCNTIPKRPNLEKIAKLRGETVNELMDYLEGRQTLSHYERLSAMISGASKEQLVSLLRQIATRLENI
ncbi:MAG: hypothetical protein HCA25_19555 [Dolichospermum sp. DET50]|nr:hypothetical protein [Dolichospermum sp. DET73]MBS3029193.1 hypothetical protein [Dolichospermum sp. DET66]MBS3034394.1 hypothetical protein [Dolichospermum sp. DET67]MBS3039597.1 hypothetical protein [Dolichospermum sp. DET50]MDK2408429.1 hypothetical protein [Aphanizomenon sp. 202]MDK2459205.1 hypothetical protein [Aphanizomenon sp. PH219]QSX66807.1 MAG: hypothetical protein EZY12_18825 [Dolichospermum sp. DET69]